MQIQVYTIPLFSNENHLAEMNAFLRSHKIIDVEKSLISDEGKSFWTFCVRYVEGAKVYPSTASSKTSTKIDYREVLTDKEFVMFSELREHRKTLAQKNGVPVYAIFTNEELAKMVKLPIISVTEVKTIQGIGVKKMEKYGKELVEMFIKGNETSK